MHWFKHTLLAGLLLSLVPLSDAMAAAAVVTDLSGTLSVEKPGGAVKLLAKNSEVDQGDILTTEKGAYARIKFTDGGEVTLRPGTRLKIDSYAYDENAPEADSFVFSLLKGGLRTVTGLVGKRGNQNAYRLNTATATIGIRGTRYGALRCNGDCGGLGNGLYLDVVEGIINASNAAGSLDVSASQYGYVESFDKVPILLPSNPGNLEFDTNLPQFESGTDLPPPPAAGCAPGGS
jgi:hypothetical protein